MSLLVTIGLVLIGAVCLVVGFATNSLPLIYVSIACSLLAAIVLVVFSRLMKRDSATGAASAAGPSQRSWSPPAPASTGTWTPSEAPPFAPPPPSPTPPMEQPTARTPAWEPEPAGEPEPTAAGMDGTGVDDDDFPIPRYDDLRVSQIQPLLGRLDLDALDLVREREELGKNRPTLLRMIDSRIELLERQSEGPGEAGAPPADGDDDLVDLDDRAAAPADEDEDDEFEDLGEADRDEEPDEQEVRAPFVAGPAASAASATDGDFPIPDYDERSVAEIIGMLDDLDNDELDMVAEREELGRNRTAILDAIDAMFDDEEEDTPPAPPPPPVSSPEPVKRAPAKAATIKAAPVAGAAAKKAAPAKSPSRKAAPVVKSPAAGAPAARTAKAPAAKVPGAKAPVSKVSKGRLPAAKIAAAKTAAAKAAPVKRVAGARKAAPAAPEATAKKAAPPGPVRARKSAAPAETAPPVKKAAPRGSRAR